MLADSMQHARHPWACYHHTARSTSPEAQFLSGRWIAAHPWPVLKSNWGWRTSTGINGSRGWNSAIERRSWVRALSLVLFPLPPYPVWAVEFSTYYIYVCLFTLLPPVYWFCVQNASWGGWSLCQEECGCKEKQIQRQVPMYVPDMQCKLYI